MIVKQQLVTAEAFWAMPEVPGKVPELVDGEVIETPGANDMHMEIMLILFDMIREHARKHDLGVVRPDGLSLHPAP